MQLETLQFGEIEAAEDRVITFPKGLLGFEGMHRYVIVDREDCHPFRWLQSVDSPELALVVVDPEVFFPGYTVSVHAREVADIGVSDPAEVEVVAIVTIPRQMEKMTVNLQGPILVNWRKRIGKQLVLTDSDYSVKHFLMEQQPESELKPAATPQTVGAT